MIRTVIFCGIFLMALVAAPIGAQPKKDPPKEPAPQIVVVPQLTVEAGKTAKLTVRGLRVDSAIEVRMHEPKAGGKIVGKGRKVAVPNQAEPKKVGDSEIDIEVTLPAEVPGNTVSFSLIGPGGESGPHSLIVIDDAPRMKEKEPNEGFRQAQPLTLPVIVEGAVQQAQDVDVFKLEAKAGEEIVCRVQAREFGSPLEPMLYLYAADRTLLATAESTGDKIDPVLKFKIPRDGTYYVSLIDANDQGGSIFVYRLKLAVK